ncbi:hypothetical protein CDD83_4250 [Cordyceps sp. RAO-2017]|nr:hypothetical protein CDD83_4250 [Cordyceps sp. RAO-2017]
MDAPAHSRLSSRALRRLTVALVAFSSTAILALGLFSLTPSGSLGSLRSPLAAPKHSQGQASCQASPDIWDAARLKYRNLSDDKFTVALQTYHRERELAETLGVLLNTSIPSLLEVVVVWNDPDTTPPGDFASPHGVPVRYRHSPRNSLNEKLWPDPAYQTQAVLLSDDDVYYRPDDLEFVFQTWRKFGRHRLTGALARCAAPRPDGSWEYSFCSRDAGNDAYSMILTNLAFAHVSLMDYYSSDDPAAQRVRSYVDDHFNCEDIALNFLASMLTGDGPLLVQGHERYVNMEPAQGISRKPHHLEARSRCLSDLADILACMPLVNETAHVERGVVPL